MWVGPSRPLVAPPRSGVWVGGSAGPPSTKGYPQGPAGGGGLASLGFLQRFFRYEAPIIFDPRIGPKSGSPGSPLQGYGDHPILKSSRVGWGTDGLPRGTSGCFLRESLRRLPLEGPRADVPVPGPPNARRHHRSHRRERSARGGGTNEAEVRSSGRSCCHHQKSIRSVLAFGMADG